MILRRLFAAPVFALVAQLAEHLTFNQRVRDSSSRERTKNHRENGGFSFLRKNTKRPHRPLADAGAFIPITVRRKIHGFNRRFTAYKAYPPHRRLIPPAASICALCLRPAGAGRCVRRWSRRSGGYRHRTRIGGISRAVRRAPASKGGGPPPRRSRSRR